MEHVTAIRDFRMDELVPHPDDPDRFGPRQREAINDDNAPTPHTLTLSADEMQKSSVDAANVIRLLFATGRDPSDIIKRLVLNVHGVLTALVPYIGGEAVKNIIQDVLLANVERVELSLIQQALDDEATQH